MEQYVQTYTLETIPIPADRRYPKMRIDFHRCGSTTLFVDGIELRSGITCLEFRHRYGEPAKLKVEFDIQDIEFAQADKEESAPSGKPPKADSES